MRGSILVLAMLTAAFAERYAFFDCNSDGSLVSYGEECSDDHCDDCEITETNLASGSCYVAGAYVHTVACDATGTNVTVKIYEDNHLTCASDLTGETPDQVHYHVAGACEEEDHDHHGDEHDEDHDYVTLSFSGTTITMQSHCSDDHCDDCEDTDTITCGACTAEEHDGETEYITYECSGSTITMKVYEGTGVAGCDDDSFLDSDETISYTVGECVEDEHGHDEHDEDEVSGARGRERASLASLLIAVGALLTAN